MGFAVAAVVVAVTAGFTLWIRTDQRARAKWEQSQQEAKERRAAEAVEAAERKRTQIEAFATLKRRVLVRADNTDLEAVEYLVGAMRSLALGRWRYIEEVELDDLYAQAEKIAVGIPGHAHHYDSKIRDLLPSTRTLGEVQIRILRTTSGSSSVI